MRINPIYFVVYAKNALTVVFYALRIFRLTPRIWELLRTLDGVKSMIKSPADKESEQGNARRIQHTMSVPERRSTQYPGVLSMF